MAIRVLNKVKHGGKYYEKDEIIKKISKNDEQRLIDLGVAISLDSKEDLDKKNEQQSSSEGNTD